MTGRPRGSVFSSARWNALGRGSQRTIRFGLSLVLARLLAPEDFGLMAVASMVIGLLDLVRDLGTGQAVVQRRELSQELLSSVFVVNVASGLGVAALIGATADLVGLAFSAREVAPLLRVMAAGFVVYSTCIVHRSLLARELRFRVLSSADVSGALANAGVAITLALLGFGVWSLVAGYVASCAVATAVFWLRSPWRPSAHFAWSDVREIRRFSLNLTASNVVNYLFQNADTLIISRALGPVELGIYSMARRIVFFPAQALGQMLGGVLLPALARVQDDLPRLRSDLLRVSQGIAMLVFPVALGAVVIADPFVRAVLGERWLPAIPVMQLLGPVALLLGTLFPVGAIYRARGRTDWLLAWGIVSGAVTAAAYWLGVRAGLSGLVLAYGAALALLWVPGQVIPLRLIALPLRRLLAALLPILAAASLMAGAAFALRTGLAALGLPSAVLVVAVSLAGGLLYAALLAWMRPPAVHDLLRALGLSDRVAGAPPAR